MLNDIRRAKCDATYASIQQDECTVIKITDNIDGTVDVEIYNRSDILCDISIMTAEQFDSLIAIPEDSISDDDDSFLEFLAYERTINWD